MLAFLDAIKDRNATKSSGNLSARFFPQPEARSTLLDAFDLTLLYYYRRGN